MLLRRGCQRFAPSLHRSISILTVLIFGNEGDEQTDQHQEPDPKHEAEIEQGKVPIVTRTQDALARVRRVVSDGGRGAYRVSLRQPGKLLG